MQFPYPVSLSELAGILQCDYAGPATLSVTGINEIHRVKSGELTFVDVPKYYRKALESEAVCVLINQSLPPPAGKGLLICDDPFSDFNRLLRHFRPDIPLAHSAAGGDFPGVAMGRHVVWGDEVQIGEGTEIGHFVSLGSHVRIGKNCRIHAHVCIGDFVEIGDEVTINANSVIGGEAFYFKNRPWGREKLLSKGGVVIGNHVDIGACVTIDRGVTSDTHIGDWSKLDNLVQIGHDTVVGRRCIIAAQTGIAGCVNVEDEVILWGQVGVNKGLTIGKGAELLGKTGVMSSLEGGKSYLGMIAEERSRYLRQEVARRKLPELLQALFRRGE